MAQSTFLVCCNCSKWGQPWRLGKRVYLCHERGYKADSRACNHFTAIDTLPASLQKIRLYVQTLDDTQRHYFQWALQQAELVLELKDATDTSLCLGDRVSFRLGRYGHIGTIEGVDPYTSNALIIATPAFTSNVSIHTTMVTKITSEEALASLESEGEQLPWKLPVLIQEIIHLRMRKKKDRENSVALVHYERQLLAYRSQIQDALGVRV